MDLTTATEKELREFRVETPADMQALMGDTHWCGDRSAPARLRIIRIVLTIAHLDHQPENCADDNLRAWCQRCHLAYDAQHHAATALRRGADAVSGCEISLDIMSAM